MTFDRPKGLDSGAHVVCNVYECPCGEVWQDRWDCGCDDVCPGCECGRYISPSDSFDDPNCDCPTCEASRAEKGTEPMNDLRKAARAMLDAFGGSAPDWLRDEAAALEKALIANQQCPDCENSGVCDEHPFPRAQPMHPNRARLLLMVNQLGNLEATMRNSARVDPFAAALMTHMCELTALVQAIAVDVYPLGFAAAPVGGN